MISATDIPDLSLLTDANSLFEGCYSISAIPNIGDWDVSHVTSMTEMFFGASSFNGDLSSWDVSNVTSMASMFYGASSFNSDVSGWDVSNVQSLSHVFAFATLFNSDVSGWDVSNVTEFDGVFRAAEAFDGDVSAWNVSKGTKMNAMFARAKLFNGDLSSWDVSKVTTMFAMFSEATIFNRDISSWNVSNVTSMKTMFHKATAFNQDISGWDVSKVRDTYYMFKYATSFNQDISGWDVSNVNDMYNLFLGITLPTPIYDNILNKWELLAKPRVPFHGGGSRYSSAAETARNQLINDHRWKIKDGGKINTVTFGTGANGSISGINNQLLDSGSSTSSVTATPDTGYYFDNWRVDSGSYDGSANSSLASDNPLTVHNVNDDLNLTAVFSPHEYSVYFGTSVNGTLTGDVAQTVSYGSNSSAVTAVPNPGYAFKQWTGDITSTVNPLVVSNVTGSVSVIAEYELVDYSLTFNASQDGSVSGDMSQTLNYGESSSLVTAVPDTGYSFEKWTVNSGTYDGSANSSLTSDNPLSVANVIDHLTLTAEFKINEYLVTFSSGENGTLNGEESQVVTHGESTTSITATPNDGYVFKQWTGTITSTENPLIIEDVTGIVSVTAEYELDDALRIEYGEISVTSDWSSISYSKEFKDPVVVIGPPTRNETDFVNVRIRNTTKTGFEVCLQEWDYLDGIHAAETVSYIVVERGSYTLPNGNVIEAGSTDISGGSFATSTFSKAFPTTPVLLSSIVTENDTAAVTRRVRNVSTSSFEIRLQEQDINAQDHGAETVNFIAVEKGSVVFEGMELLISSVNPVDERVKDVGIFGYDYFIASDQTYAGSDNGSLRMQGTPQEGVQLIFEEEQSKDDELKHANETVAYIAVKPYVEEPEVNLEMEIGNLVVGIEWQTVNVSGTYADPVVITGPVSHLEAEPVTVKIRNVTATSFEIKLQEFAYQNQMHLAENLTFMVVERGSYKLPGGKRLIADSVDLTNSTRKTVDLGSELSSLPIVFASVVTDNDTTAVTTRIRNVNANSFQIRMREAEIADHVHATETVNYVAIESGTITASGYELFASTIGRVTHADATVPETGYSMLIADQQTENGGDTAWVRMKGDISTDVKVFIEEEQSKNLEVNHAAESVGYLLAKVSVAQQQSALHQVAQTQGTTSSGTLESEIVDEEFDSTKTEDEVMTSITEDSSGDDELTSVETAAVKIYEVQTAEHGLVIVYIVEGNEEMTVMDPNKVVFSTFTPFGSDIEERIEITLTDLGYKIEALFLQ
ncbi:MAG: BspA family leucine-rich repeat surface protein [Lentisphaerales bacterium]|nr:BspA family leucine-rich repeat surface protein [Lentisphaerales bacterium]